VASVEIGGLKIDCFVLCASINLLWKNGGVKVYGYTDENARTRHLYLHFEENGRGSGSPDRPFKIHSSRFYVR